MNRAAGDRGRAVDAFGARGTVCRGLTVDARCGLARRGRRGLIAGVGPRPPRACRDLRPSGLRPLGTLLEVHNRRIPAPQRDQDRSRDEDRAVGTDDQADEQHERQVEQNARAEPHDADDQNGQDRERPDDSRVDRADHRLVDGEVGGLGVGGSPIGEGFRGVLAHLVEDDDRVVDRVAQDREETDHGRG